MFNNRRASYWLLAALVIFVFNGCAVLQLAASLADMAIGLASSAAQIANSSPVPPWMFFMTIFA